MAPLFENLLGSNAKDRKLTEEMREVLNAMQSERARCEKLMDGTRDAADRLQQLGEPLSRASSDVDSMSGRLVELERRFEAMTQLSAKLINLDERIEDLTKGHQSAQVQVANTLQEAQNLREVFEDLGQKVNSADDLKASLVAFLEVEKPFQQLRGDGDALRGQLESTVEQMARLREQNDRLLDAHKLAMSKMEALDRRREDMSRDLQDKERRIVNVQGAVRGMDGMQQTVDEVRREMGTLKALGDSLSQKSAALEAQREAVERALGRADHLDRAMRQIDAGVRQQVENERTLSALHDQVVALRSLHESAVERSSEITQLQRSTDDQARGMRDELVSLQSEMQKTVDRFDFESRGLESVTQRVADLRGALNEFETRFKHLGESIQTVNQLRAQTNALTGEIQALASEAARIDGEAAKLQAIRRDLDETGRTAKDASDRVARIAEAQPALQAALQDLGQLNGAHARVGEALEQLQLSHEEIERVRGSQSETRAWIAEVEGSLANLRNEVAEVHAIAPSVEVVQKQAQRLADSMSYIESRREFVDDLQRRATELGSLGARLDDRSKQLATRMEAAEQQFNGLAENAEEAEKLGATLAKMSAGVNDAARRSAEVAKAVAGIGQRCDSIEELAERTRALKPELEQRQQTLAKAAKELENATALRAESAESARQLDELSRRLAGQVSSAGDLASKAEALTGRLEDRGRALGAVDKRMRQFEESMQKWSMVEEEVGRALEQISNRQGTIEVLQTDLDRMFAMAEKTASEVREITSAHDAIEQSRGLLQDVMGRLREVKDMNSALDDRKRQMVKAEERLARAEALLVDVRSSLEALQGQKAIVDQAVEKAGSLQFLLKQAEAMIDGLREEREMSARVHTAMGVVRGGAEADAGEDLAEAA